MGCLNCWTDLIFETPSSRLQRACQSSLCLWIKTKVLEVYHLKHCGVKKGITSPLNHALKIANKHFPILYVVSTLDSEFF